MTLEYHRARSVPYVVLALLSGALAAGLWFGGGVHPESWRWCSVAVCLAGLLALGASPRQERAPTDRWLCWSLAALGAWMLLQLCPLPEWLAGALGLESGARAYGRALMEALPPETARALGAEGLRAAGAQALRTISVSPVRGWVRVLDWLPCLVAVLAVREVAWRWKFRLWTLTLPLIGLATLEALLGLAQFAVFREQGATMAPASGTYVNRNHFSGLLEMMLPLAATAAITVWRAGERRYTSSGRRALATVALAGAGVAALLAIVASLSRMGFLSTVAALVLTGVLAVGANRAWDERRRRWIAPAVVGVLILCGAVLLPSEELILRFADIAQTDDISADTRAQIWRETGPMIRHYGWLGCGVGAYQSGFYAFKKVAPTYTVDFAHNDYLQGLAELGYLGFGLAVGGVACVFWRLGRVVLFRRGGRHWELALGLAGGLCALLLHSLVDYNLHVPANALVAAWLCGLATAANLEEG